MMTTTIKKGDQGTCSALPLYFPDPVCPYIICTGRVVTQVMNDQAMHYNATDMKHRGICMLSEGACMIVSRYSRVHSAV